MVTGLYALLATSASVFIGVLTAVLASKISNMESEQAQIEHRIDTIDARLKSLNTQRQDLEEQIDEILDLWERQDEISIARRKVRKFVDNHVGDDFDPDSQNLEPEDIAEEYADYADMAEVEVKTDEYLMDEIKKQSDDIEQKLERDANSAKNMIVQDPDASATHRQTEIQQQIHQREEYNRYQNRWHQTTTELQSLVTERNRLASQYSSIDSSTIIGALKIGVFTIFLSVVIPSVTYLFHEIDYVVSDQPAWIEPSSIFLIWLIGLVIIFTYLRIDLNKESGGLPEQPDIEMDGKDVDDLSLTSERSS
jgi:hypothetical protein